MAQIDLSDKTQFEPRYSDGANVTIGSGTYKLFTADGDLPISDYYALTPTVSGLMNVVLQEGSFAVRGITIYNKNGAVLNEIDAPRKTRRLTVSGTFVTTGLDPVYAYIKVKDRSPVLFTVNANAST